ncbi:unnamed protein product [Amoebophrya sp. A25]|nr:unnamed protein product [Amoebophrya sp. A25]|eukprot:GSA25T00013437001.1
MLSRILSRNICKAPRQPATQRTGKRFFSEKVEVRGQSTATQTPIMYYSSTQQATSSINHRLFYINAVGTINLFKKASYQHSLSNSNMVSMDFPNTYGYPKPAR